MTIFAVFVYLMCASLTYGHFKESHENGGKKCFKGHQHCILSIPSEKETVYCKKLRSKDIKDGRKFYKLTSKGEKKVIMFPLEFIPFLNQTIENVVFHTAMDPVDSRWLAKVSTIKSTIAKIIEAAAKEYGNFSMADGQIYQKAFNFHNLLIKKMHHHFEYAQKYFSNPAMYPTFTDVISNNRYLTDDIFVQKRFAGPCPFLIKLVTENENVGFQWSKLKQLLNPNYDFDAALRHAIGGRGGRDRGGKGRGGRGRGGRGRGMTLEKSVKRGIIYVLYHEENNDMDTTPDFFDQYLDHNHALINITSTITLFARTASGELKVVAIQWDYKNDSEVLSPQSEQLKWLLAKSMADQGDLNVCQAVWHLSHMHLSAGVYCTLFKSHLSKLHPLHEIMKYHCEGTTPHISTTYMALVAPNSFGHQVFSIGNEGYTKLTVTGFYKFEYGLLAYDNVLKKHGLDSMKLKYHPFRDDGKIIWERFQDFAKKFTDIFYQDDKHVRNDYELQSFAEQVSIDGKGESYGGKGNIIGFPMAFKTKDQLCTFITRFLWQIAMHASVNYALEPWTTFIPTYPTKLFYHNAASLNYTLPGAMTSIAAIKFASLLGNVRVNSIMDYYAGIRDKKLSKLVSKYNYQFHECVQKLLEDRNAERKSKNQMGFQYFEPKWLTNSIHI